MTAQSVGYMLTTYSIYGKVKVLHTLKKNKVPSFYIKSCQIIFTLSKKRTFKIFFDVKKDTRVCVLIQL